MAVFVTGDCHGKFDKIEFFAKRMKLTEKDYVIVLGDMGLFWRKDREDSNYFIKYFEDNFKFNLYFIDGNQRRNINDRLYNGFACC